MNTRPATLILATTLLLLRATAAPGQTTDPPYLSQFPPVERVMREVRGADPVDTAARQGVTFNTLRLIIIRLVGTRSDKTQTPDERRLMKTYGDAWGHLYDVMPTPADKERYSKLQTSYLEDPAFSTDEILKRLFPPEFRASYYRVRGMQPPAPSAMEVWQQTLSKGDTFKGEDDFFIYFASREHAHIYCRRSMMVDPKPYTVEKRDGSVIVTLGLSPEPWSLELQADGSLRSLGIDTVEFGSGKRCSVGVLRPEPKKKESAAGAPVPPAGGAKAAPTPAAPSANSAAAYVAEGDKHLQAGEFAKAVEAFKKAISLEPSGYTYNELGNSYAGLGQQANALTAYKQAARLLPDDPVIQHNLGSTYLFMQQYENAKASLLEALRLKPDYADAFNQLGVAYFRLKQYPEAAVQFQQGLRIKPDDAVLLHNIGKTNFYMGRKEEARRIYEKLLTVDKGQAQKLYEVINAGAALGPGARGGARSPAPPSARPGARGGGSADEYLAEGETYFETKDYARAVEAFKEAIALKPSDEAYGWLGLARLQLKQYPEAMTAHLQAVKLNPTEASHHSNLGNVYLLMGQNEKAVDPLRESLRLEPEPAVYVLLAITYHKLEQFPEEVMVLQQALKLAPDDASAHLQLGYAYVALRRKAEALRTYQNLQTIDPERAKSLRDEIEAYLDTDDPKLFWRVADAALASKHYESMLRAYHHIIALKPADSAVLARAHNGRGQAFVGLKKYERAAAEYREAISRDPKQPGYYLNLGTTYLAMGKKAQAQQVYKTLLTLDKQKAQELLADINKAR
jgi:tetratricopeptide (TPR) repeat protein